MTSVRTGLVLAAVLLAHAGAAPAQERDPLARGLELERRGAAAAAAEAYQSALRERPADLAALLGLERVTATLGAPERVVPAARAALAANPALGPAWGVLVRAWGVTGAADSAQVAAEAWAALEPASEEPWRELAGAALNRADRVAARAALEEGRRRLRQPDALAPELAALAAAERRWPEAATEWARAIRIRPDNRLTALASLSRTPPSEREAVLRSLAAMDAGGTPLLASALLARWGEPARGWEMLRAHLPAGQLAAADALREFTELVRRDETPAGRLAFASATELLIPLAPAAQHAALRTEAGRAYAEAGRPADARRVLGELADASGSSTLGRQAAGTMIVLLLDEGRLDEAEARLGTAEGLPATERRELRHRLALAWGASGEPVRALRVAGSDSTVEGLALRGELALLRGAVTEGRRLLTAAGPFAGGRDAGAQRTARLALVQGIEVDSLGGLGAGLRALASGDSVEGVRHLVRTADGLAADKGGAALLQLAGEVEARQGRVEEARALFTRVAGTKVPASAPAALLGLARLSLAQGAPAEAVASLEALILGYPESALVPEARRLLDSAHGVVPST